MQPKVIENSLILNTSVQHGNTGTLNHVHKTGADKATNLLGKLTTVPRGKTARHSRNIRNKPRLIFSPLYALILILILVVLLSASITLLFIQASRFQTVSEREQYSRMQESQAESPSQKSHNTSSKTAKNSSNADNTEQLDTSVQVQEQAETHELSQKSDTSPPEADLRVNINQATLEELQSVKGIGPVTAQKILDYRKRYGYFKSVEQLLEISGIGNKTFQKIQQHVRVS